MKKLLFVMNPYAGMRRANRFLTVPGTGPGLWRPWPDVRIWWSVPVETAPSMRR